MSPCSLAAFIEPVNLAFGQSVGQVLDNGAAVLHLCEAGS